MTENCEHFAEVITIGDSPIGTCQACGRRVRTPGPDEGRDTRSGMRAMWVDVDPRPQPAWMRRMQAVGLPPKDMTGAVES